MLCNLIFKMTKEVGRKLDVCIFDIISNHRYFPIMKTSTLKRIILDNLALLFCGK